MGALLFRFHPQTRGAASSGVLKISDSSLAHDFARGDAGQRLQLPRHVRLVGITQAQRQLRQRHPPGAQRGKAPMHAQDARQRFRRQAAPAHQRRDAGCARTSRRRVRRCAPHRRVRARQSPPARAAARRRRPAAPAAHRPRASEQQRPGRPMRSPANAPRVRQRHRRSPAPARRGRAARRDRCRESPAPSPAGTAPRRTSPTLTRQSASAVRSARSQTAARPPRRRERRDRCSHPATRTRRPRRRRPVDPVDIDQGPERLDRSDLLIAIHEQQRDARCVNGGAPKVDPTPSSPADECPVTPTVLGLGVHEFACICAALPIETRGCQGQALA